MKDSGIPWIGEIPADWKKSRFKYSGSFTKGKLPKDTNSDGIGTPIMGASEMLGKASRQYSLDPDSITCNNNDVLILWDGANAGITSSNLSGIVSSTAVKYTLTNHCFIPSFVALLFKSAERYFKGKVNGTTIPHMSMSFIDDIPMLCPSMSEQQKIAIFLDQKCKEVDELIALQEKMIEELKAYQYSVIGEVTTKGLNKDVQYIDSGVDWMGSIPSHWKITIFREYGIECKERNIGNKTNELLALSFSLGVTLYKDKLFNKDRVKNDYEEYKIVKKEDLVLSPNDIIKGSVFVSEYDGCISPMYLIFHPRNSDTHNFRYLSYLLRNRSVGRRFFFMARGMIGEILENGKYVTRRMSVSKNDITGFKVLLPPISEQVQIVDYLDLKCKEIETLISIKQSKIAELQDYKKSLIYEYVTGKKEVL